MTKVKKTVLVASLRNIEVHRQLFVIIKVVVVIILKIVLTHF